jgi:SAM-dependent methyltransferase
MTGSARVIERALQTAGLSSDAIYRTVAATLRSRMAQGLMVDVGCGVGRLRDFTQDFVTDYVGVDVIRHTGLPDDITFVGANLDRGPIPLPSESADIVAAIETIEHLENPRAFFRELVRILRPAGSLVISTPNQASILNLLSLAAKGEFAAFRAPSYPAHRTALLPIDMVRIAGECGLRDVELKYTHRGRIPLTAMHYPEALARALPRALSDNVVLVAGKDA